MQMDPCDEKIPPTNFCRKETYSWPKSIKVSLSNKLCCSLKLKPDCLLFVPQSNFDDIDEPFVAGRRMQTQKQEYIVPKKSVNEKNWPLYALDGVLDDNADDWVVTIVWRRYIVAAKCILIKIMIHCTGANEYMCIYLNIDWVQIEFFWNFFLMIWFFST